MIDQCGLKETRFGDAEVSTKHAGFIINKGNADFNQLMELIDLVKKNIKEKKDLIFNVNRKSFGENQKLMI